jgi:hypothetical protein
MRLHDETGLVGKIIIIWLVMVVLLGIAALDTASVVFATFRASDIAATAASAGANTYDDTKEVRAACDSAEASVEGEDPDMKLPKTFCKVDTKTGEVTITIRRQATTIVAGRLSFTDDLTIVVGKETAGPSAL